MGLIPIRCTCNAVVAGKWNRYQQMVKEKAGDSKIAYLSATQTKTIHGKILDDLKVTKPCCRRMFLTQVGEGV